MARTKASTPSGGSSSYKSGKNVVEQLQMLRSFIGNEQPWSEKDLATCLSQSGYLVELAAERLMTGQYQPAKRLKATSPIAGSTHVKQAPLSKEPPVSSSTLHETDNFSLKPPATPNDARKALHPNQTATKEAPMGKETKMQALAEMTSSSVQPSIVTPKTPKLNLGDPPSSTLASSWLLCQRWVSNGACTTRNGNVDYKEQFALEHTETGTPMVRFRGAQIQGQFPKHLSQMLTPLLRNRPPLVLLKAEALMEDRNLPVGADVAFSIRYARQT